MFSGTMQLFLLVQTASRRNLCLYQHLLRGKLAMRVGLTKPPNPIVSRLFTLNQKHASANDMCEGISPIRWLRSSQITWTARWPPLTVCMTRGSITNWFNKTYVPRWPICSKNSAVWFRLQRFWSSSTKVRFHVAFAVQFAWTLCQIIDIPRYESSE